MDFLYEVWLHVRPVALSLLYSVATLLAAYALYFLAVARTNLKKKTEKIEDESTRNALNAALEDLFTTVERVVLFFKQTVIDDIKALGAGNYSKEELLEVGRQAVAKVIEFTSEEAKELITKQVGNFESYVQALIEAQIGELKLLEPPKPPADPVDPEEPTPEE